MMDSPDSIDDYPGARIEQQPSGTWAIVNDDTNEVVVDGFATKDLAEQSALAHDFAIVVE